MSVYFRVGDVQRRMGYIRAPSYAAFLNRVADRHDWTSHIKECPGYQINPETGGLCRWVAVLPPGVQAVTDPRAKWYAWLPVTSEGGDGGG